MNTQKNNSRLSTDPVVVSIFKALQQDFRCTYGDTMGRGITPPGTSATQLKLFRNQVFIDYSGTTPGRYKPWYQLENLCKKYVFENDIITKKERESLTYEKYFVVQKHLSSPRWDSSVLPASTSAVLREARRIARVILGPYDKEEHMKRCRFGRNSSIGCSLANSYLDYKLGEGDAFTSSVSAYKSFVEYLKRDATMSRLLKKQLARGPMYVRSLPLQTVPKTWKIDRLITPLPLVDQFISTGYGEYVASRLADHQIDDRRKLDIRKLQGYHREFVRKYSRNGSHATVDLSSASDCITIEMLMRILPRPWLNALKPTLFRSMQIGESEAFTTLSILPMGNGATFPVETLLFYCLIRAIGNLTKLPGTYSVYGDDIIIPRKAYRFLIAVFGDLGLLINKDKSFSDGYFRESCGADYHSGIPVRPYFLPEREIFSQYQSTRYIAWLHKVINGLLSRWDPNEISRTLTVLFIELTMANGAIYLVPPSFPDTSGVRVQEPDVALLPHPFPWAFPKLCFASGTRYWTFRYLKCLFSSRYIRVVDAYYWDKVRSRTLNQPDYEDIATHRSYKEVLLPLEAYALKVHCGASPGFSTIVTSRIRKWRSKTTGKVCSKKDVRVEVYGPVKGVTFYGRALLRRNSVASKRREDPLITVWG